MMERTNRSKIAWLLSLSFPDQLNALWGLYFQIKGRLYYRRIFASFGKKTILYPPILINNARYIHIGDRVMIRDGARIEAVVLDPANPPEIWIGNNVNIGQDVHIVAIGKLIIHDNVSITARCSLLCGTHPFFDVRNPVSIGKRLAGKDAILEIGEGSFLGVGSTVQMNVRIGRHVVVGSNAVVRKSVPDYTVVAGNPAVVVMRYEEANDRWVTVEGKN